MNQNCFASPMHWFRSLNSRAQKTSSPSGCAAVPRVSRWLLRGFTWYSRRYIRRHFHSLRIARDRPAIVADGWPLVIYANHASWWDPLVGLVLQSELFPARTIYCPIDAGSLERYRLLARLGFFAVEPDCAWGVTSFVRTSKAVMQDAGSILALTPQGRFADARERPLRFRAGLGHLASRTERALFWPVAIEYVFWEERLPEILVQLGEPIEICDAERGDADRRGWTNRLQDALADAQDRLAKLAQERNPARFRTVLHGSSGQGGVYDIWRLIDARLFGATFRKEHGCK